ncbi:MAG: hypothetical protein NXI04_16305 [Planctomycetaceae bacterium]|nr:hypothetical protein [Planctomycetaceae bacterium]
MACDELSEAIRVADLISLAQLVEEDKVGVSWTALSEIGPEWIGSRRKVTFFVDGTPLAENEVTCQLADRLITGLGIPATGKDHVISGEGNLRLNGTVIEVLYDWDKTVPYDDSIEAGSGEFRLVDLVNPQGT